MAQEDGPLQSLFEKLAGKVSGGGGGQRGSPTGRTVSRKAWVILVVFPSGPPALFGLLLSVFLPL